MSNYNKFIGLISKKRTWIQVIIGVALYIAINKFQISLWWVLGLGTVTGIIWGKVFCRWMCPVGILMELMMKFNSNESFKTMYQYHKIGCPIAWISGLLNKVSLFKIQLNTETCKNCGLCDSACYMPTINKEKFSLFQIDKSNPAENFSCSKCLSCVTQCPNGSLSYKPVLPFNKLKNISV